MLCCQDGTAVPEDHPHECVGGAEAVGAAGQVENGRGGGGPDPLAARGGATQADHRHQERHVGPPRSPSARLPQHRHQGQRAPAAFPGMPQGLSGCPIQYNATAPSS